MADIKKFSKKLRGKHTIEVDAQIARWRKKLKKNGTLLGKGARATKRKNDAQNEANEIERNGGLAKKKWF